MSNWIPASEKPAISEEWPCSKDILFTDGKDIYLGYLSDLSEIGEDFSWLSSNGYEIDDVTHWMPLPELPKSCPITPESIPPTK